MHSVLIVTVVFSGIVLALAIISGTILMAIKIIKGGVSRKNRDKLTTETAMVQEIYQGLGQLEERIETLETILLDREKRTKNDK
jgi:phage shock protein B